MFEGDTRYAGKDLGPDYAVVVANSVMDVTTMSPTKPGSSAPSPPEWNFPSFASTPIVTPTSFAISPSNPHRRRTHAHKPFLEKLRSYWEKEPCNGRDQAYCKVHERLPAQAAYLTMTVA